MSAGKKDEGAQEEGKQAGFKVSDRRSFVEPPPDTEPPAATEQPPAATEPGFSSTEESANGLPPVDFHTFILSLGSSALLHLGELDHPDGGEARPDLRLAKHTIDIIGMLQEKTRGNLNPPEERLMESLLFDLRLRYVERGKKPQ